MDIGLLAEVGDWLKGSWAAIPSFGRFLAAASATALTVLLPARSVLRWIERQKIARKLREAATSPEAPDLDPNTPELVFHAQGFSPTEKAVDLAVEIHARATQLLKGGHVEAREIAKAATTGEQWEFMALEWAKNAHGLHYLPKRVAFPLQLYLARQYLSWADAPPEAKQLITDRLDDADKGNFFAALFNPAALADVDMNPESGGGDTYFKKFFQPLMVSFAKSAYSRTAGDIPEREALYQHLVYLSKRRIVAARLTPGCQRVDPKTLTERLPRQLPPGKYGKKMERVAVAKYNREEAAQAVLIISEPSCIWNAEVLERVVQQAWNSCGADAKVWTPITDPPPDQACFLWQTSGKDQV